MIPKIIHQIFIPIHYDRMPDKWKEASDKWKVYHPDFEYKLWGYDDCLQLLKQYYPWFLDTWFHYKYKIQQIDAVRYFILYHYGGFYIDMDYKPNRRIDSYLLESHTCVVTQHDFFINNLSNGFIGCIKQHPFMEHSIRHLIDYKNKSIYTGKHNHVINSTGPNFLTSMFHQYSRNDIFVLSHFMSNSGCDICNHSICKPGYMFDTSNGKSWYGNDSKLYEHFRCNYKLYLVFLLLLIFICILSFYNHKKFQLYLK